MNDNNQQSAELTVAGAEYRVGKMSALEQFHVTRRLGPMLVVAGVSVEMLSRGMKAELDDLVAMAGPVMEILSRMSDEDTNYVILTCLKTAHRRQGDAWAPVLAKDGRTLMFADMDMPTMVRIVIEVLKLNLGNFLTGLGDGLPSPSSSTGQGQPQATTPRG